MTRPLGIDDVHRVGARFDPTAPERSWSPDPEIYIDPRWADLETLAVFRRSWQFVTHVERLRKAGSYVATEVAGMPVMCVRDGESLRAFYNVCRHRAHELLAGSGQLRVVTCPYHGWSYRLDGSLRSARSTDLLPDFDPADVCLHPVLVEELSGLVFVNLDPEAESLATAAPELASDLAAHAPDLAALTHARRLTYDIEADWKSVIDNFLECYHCPIAHRDFVSLVDMTTYSVTTYDIHSAHMARAGTAANSAYSVDEATVTEHAVWWLWPNTALLRYPGRGNFMVWRILPAGSEATREIFDFYFETADPTDTEREALAYIDEVLQVEDIGLVESVQRGMRTPGFAGGRYVVDPELEAGKGSGLSEHALHHFHGLLLEAYARELSRPS